MRYQDYIEIIPGRRNGQPCIVNTRITVYDVLGWMSNGMTAHDIVEDYPELDEMQIQACLGYAAHREHHTLAVA